MKQSRSALESNGQDFIHLVAKFAPKLHVSVAGPNASVWSRAVTCIDRFPISVARLL